MRKALLLMSAIALLSVPALAKVTISPGISFLGFSEPYITVETALDSLQSVKFLVGKEGLIASFRLWPTSDTAWPWRDDVVPTFIGFGMKSIWGDGMAVAGFYAEAGIKAYNTVEIGFSLEQFGSEGRIAINLGLSFTLSPGPGEQGGQ